MLAIIRPGSFCAIGTKTDFAGSINIFRTSELSPYNPFLISHLEKEYAEIINWYLGEYKRNEEHPEHLQFPVKLGFKVRSKSEVMEADKLFEAGILFHYHFLKDLEFLHFHL